MKTNFGPASLLRCAFLRIAADSAMAKPPNCTHNIYIIRLNRDACQEK